MIGECWANVVFGDDILDICYWLLPLARRQRGDTGEQPRHRLRIFDSAYRKGALSRILDRGADVVGLGAAESLQVDIHVDKQNPFPRAEVVSYVSVEGP